MPCCNSDSDKQPENLTTRFPSWLKRSIAHSGKHKSIMENIHSSGLHTVCVEAKCPNRSECYSKGTATFLILGNICTRFCTFCGVNHGAPMPVDVDEPEKLIGAIKSLKLNHVVITSVTRDDLSDGGAAIYAETITRIKQALPAVTVEILIPDFNGNQAALELVISKKPDIFNHNIETIPRLYSSIRPQALYQRSLDVLSLAARSGLTVKSGIMVGLGEIESEVHQVMRDLYSAGCRILTIGQYLRPSKQQTPVIEHVSPEQFSSYEKVGQALGFSSVFAGPFVRSSYMAEKIFQNVLH
jgi:lipoic acid synthetase